MNEKSNKYAVAALKKKRASLSGEIAQLQKKLAWAQGQLKHVDATLALFDPQLNPGDIPPARPSKRIKMFRQGELNRLILDALRMSDGPMRTFDVITAVMLALGHEETARPALGPRVRSNLQYLLRQKGDVQKIGSGTSARWTLRSND